MSPVVVSRPPPEPAASPGPGPSSSAPPPALDVPPPARPAPLSSADQLLGSVAVWRPAGLGPDAATWLLEQQPAGTFLAHSAEDRVTMLSVRLPDEGGAPAVRSVAVQQLHTFVHLEGSSLVFDDIFKLISFYCASRDILAMPLKLPLSVTVTTREEELEVLSAMGADFWTSDLNQRTKNQDQTTQPNIYLYVNPVPVEERPSTERKPSSVSKLESILSEEVTSSLQNGEISKKPLPQVKVPKRPPPRPPSLSSSSGMGLLLSSPRTSTSVTPESKRKEEGRGTVSEKEERKLVSTSPPPSRPSVPQHTRGAAPPPPAPMQRTSGCQLPAKENGQNPTKKTDREREKRKEKSGSRAGLLGEEAELEEKVKSKEKEEEQEMKMEDKLKTNSPSSPSAKKPSRPVPPPRTKPSFTNSPACSDQAGGGSTNRSAAIKIPPPAPTQRPDVSLYAPQGGAAMAVDLDSCSTSSTEEEGELNQEQELNHKSPADSRCSKAAVRRTPTTVILDRARHRLSTVLSGFIFHDSRLTKRIVELARDPLSYFGNLVKDHRAFTLETMSKHSTSTELLQEIRQMMTQLKSYLLQSTELQALLEPQHQYTQDKLENIVEAALCKSVLKPLKEPIYKSLEKLHTDAGTMKQLAQNQSVVLSSTTTSLGITTSIPEAPALEKISQKLSRLHQEYSPQKKIELLLKTCRVIYDAMSVSCPGRAHGADDFLPVMMYVLARSNLAALQLDVEYMMELMDPSLTLGEGSYYLTTTYGALEHIKTFDQQRSATRQLSREVQDSIHRWERRRTLNQERAGQDSVRDFLTVFCPEIGVNPKTLGVLPTMTIQELTEQCAARFEQDCFTLSVSVDGVLRPLAPAALALSVKSSSQPGACCFVFHPAPQDRAPQDPAPQDRAPQDRACPPDPPPAPPAGNLLTGDNMAVAPAEPEEEALIDL
ncbi:ras and Rab interactor 3 [Anableps anableps]